MISPGTKLAHVLEVTWLLASCWMTETRQTRADEDLRDEMDEHWEQSTAVRDALIHGDLRRAQKQAGRLADRLPLVIPRAAGISQESVRGRAEAIAQAQDVAAASEQLGYLAQACGECHTSVGVELRLEEAPRPSLEHDLVSEMARHQWAAEQMWMGLVAGQPERFELAVGVLGPATLSVSRLDVRVGDGDREAGRLERRVHALAKVSSAPSQRAQPSLYGQIIATCATCHEVRR